MILELPVVVVVEVVVVEHVQIQSNMSNRISWGWKVSTKWIGPKAGDMGLDILDWAIHRPLPIQTELNYDRSCFALELSLSIKQSP
jgi:hypothetical protein